MADCVADNHLIGTFKDAFDAAGVVTVEDLLEPFESEPVLELLQLPVIVRQDEDRKRKPGSPNPAG